MNDRLMQKHSLFRSGKVKNNDLEILILWNPLKFEWIHKTFYCIEIYVCIWVSDLCILFTVTDFEMVRKRINDMFILCMINEHVFILIFIFFFSIIICFYGQGGNCVNSKIIYMRCFGAITLKFLLFVRVTCNHKRKKSYVWE